MKTFDLRLKVGRKQGASEQIQHSIYCNGEHIGVVYDNTDMDESWGGERFVFAVSAKSRVNGKFLMARHEREAYIHRADTVRGEDLAEVLSMVREWVETVYVETEALRAEFFAVLDALPAVEFENPRDIQEWGGEALGPRGKVAVELTADQAAKVIAYGFEELGGWQVIDPEFYHYGSNGKRYGASVKWQYNKMSDTISYVNGSYLLTTERLFDRAA